jgi:ATP-binding cassette, subfamily F, member 3
MQPIAAEVDSEVVPFRFQSPERPLGNPLIRIEGASVGYDPGKPVLRDVDLRLDCDDRVGLLGANGNGKSTLAKLLCGKLPPLDGFRRASKKLEYGYFAQHQMDELRPKLSAYDHIAELMPDATEAQKRAKIAGIGFGADKADTPSEKLSGGEKARLLFALATFHAPHLLILDEPTNHLDVDSREALIHALNDYGGAVILISHDRHLLEAAVDRLWVVRDGTVASYDGDLESYRQESLAGRGRPSGSANGSNGSRPALCDAKRAREQERRQTAQRRAELAPLRKQLSDHERRIEMLQLKIAAIDVTLAGRSLYEKEPEKVRALTLERAMLTKDLKSTEDAWFEASLAYEEAAAAM